LAIREQNIKAAGPGSRPGECTGGPADTFEAARAAFELAWAVFLSKRTEADFRAWREH
jgi:hypothetical protein